MRPLCLLILRSSKAVNGRHHGRVGLRRQQRSSFSSPFSFFNRNVEDQKQSSSSSVKMGWQRRRASSGEESSNQAMKSISLLLFLYATKDGVQRTLLPLMRW
ncbi:hypothetical protein MRB53_005763 [Persea americana]|uniref:Uncharacterized protein n=1 Tax=Persea americana TaxID=3435 RepID=A0ACC2MEZ9_PERAE|nr:hypothetical protein MRB53_005763 [Persea americana]